MIQGQQCGPQQSGVRADVRRALFLAALAVQLDGQSALKDYLDLWVLLGRETLDAGTLATAIAATFHRRSTALSNDLPIGLSDEFANDASRQSLWAAFLKKNDLAAEPLHKVVTALRSSLQPALARAVLLQVPT